MNPRKFELKWRKFVRIAIAGGFVGACGCALGQNRATLDETAHLLAGLPVTGPLAPLTQNPAWQEHAAAMNKAWKTKEYFQLGPIASWMSAHAGDYYRSSNTMYYMFSGPDFLYANLFFPNASTYILAGLESIGQVPDLVRMPPEMFRSELAALRGSVNTILKFQYFITKGMRAE